LNDADEVFEAVIEFLNETQASELQRVIPMGSND
jgi:hypothetical protein